jgi:glutamine amidotransferase
MYMDAAAPRDPAPLLERFSAICEDSEEYQGHGWGAMWIENGEWKGHRSLTPIWEEPALRLPRASRLLVHARSAFRDRGIELTNNMPFRRDDTVFAFNGELHGVRVRAAGRIGAEKIFNLHRAGADDPAVEARRVRDLLLSRTRRILGMNWIFCTFERTIVSSHLGERPGYYTMHMLEEDGRLLISSEPLNENPEWEEVPEGILEVATCTS